MNKEERLRDLREKRDRAYCDCVAQAQRDECLGYEQKLKLGCFGKKELEAHIRFGELLGRHRAFGEMFEAALADPTPCATEERLPALTRCSRGAGHEGEHAWASEDLEEAWLRNTVSQPAVPPAMQRALGEGEYNTIAEELRKLGNVLAECSKLDDAQEEVNASLARTEASLQLILQKLDGLERIENDCEYLGGLCAKANDRLLGLEDLSVQLVRMEKCQQEKHRLALESIVRILEKLTGGARKRQPKPVRRKGKR